MTQVTEKFLSFLWKYNLYDSEMLFFDGEKIEVLKPGEDNNTAGPNFINSEIRFGNNVRAGNIKIRVRSSDFSHHDQDTSPAYNNIILQITTENDMSVFSPDGQMIPTITLTYNQNYLENYIHLMEQELWIPCANKLNKINDIYWSSWKPKLCVERLESHADSIISNLISTVNDWEEVLYRQLAKSFGFNINSFPFEALAKALPYKILRKYRNDAFQLEAILFGQAGLLSEPNSHDEYFNKLKTEYEILHKKHSLKSIEPHLWKFMRVRPGNFPTVRIAQFARFIHLNPSFFQTILEAIHVQNLLNLLKIDVSGYWMNHYTFENATRSISKPLGDESGKAIIINTIIPFYFIYGKEHGLPHIQEKALQFLEMLGPEKNSMIDRWNQLGIRSENAFDTQALLEQKIEYCDKKRCLDCGIGLKIISST